MQHTSANWLVLILVLLIEGLSVPASTETPAEALGHCETSPSSNHLSSTLLQKRARVPIDSIIARKLKVEKEEKQTWALTKRNILACAGLACIAVIVVVGFCFVRPQLSQTDTATPLRPTPMEKKVTEKHRPAIVHEDIEKCRNLNLDDDTYGFAISSLVRDIMMIVSGEGTFALRFFRLALSLGLLFFNIFMQLFLIRQVERLCAAKYVHDIRDSYDEYEWNMYGRNESHMTITVNGRHRGIDGFFVPHNFENLSADIKEEVCSIPFSQPEFFIAILYIWTLTCTGEIKSAVDLFHSLVVSTPTSSTMLNALQKTRDSEPGETDVNEKVIAHLTLPVKMFLSVFMLLPRLLVTSYLCFVGCNWLAATNDFGDLLMNAVALEFVLLLKNLLYYVLVPDRNKRDLRNTEIVPLTKYQPASYWVFLGTFLWAFVAAAWCLFYTYWLQGVLPDYRWDVRSICEQWVQEVTDAVEFNETE